MPIKISDNASFTLTSLLTWVLNVHGSVWVTAALISMISAVMGTSSD